MNATTDELTAQELDQIVGGMTVSKLTDASSPLLMLSDPPPRSPAPPKSVDIFKFAQAFGS